VDHGVDHVAFLAQDFSVLGISGSALQTVCNQLLQTDYVVAVFNLTGPNKWISFSFSFFWIRKNLLDANFVALLSHFFDISFVSEFELGWTAQTLGNFSLFHAGLFVHRSCLVQQLFSGVQVLYESIGVEVNVGKSSEERFQNEDVDFVILNVLKFSLIRLALG
jgi:hypothetical protein